MGAWIAGAGRGWNGQSVARDADEWPLSRTRGCVSTAVLAPPQACLRADLLGDLLRRGRALSHQHVVCTLLSRSPRKDQVGRSASS
jgi:hypothetical protein